jgi:glycosyltransferase involved in cell wall biosynthesis
MQKIAPVRFYRNSEEREAILREEAVDFFYCVKNGLNDGVFSRTVPTGVHAIFRESEFHGDVYAYISDWLSRVMAYGRASVAPWMVRLAETTEDLKAEVGIPEGAWVWGRHGGEDSFDIPWVHQGVAEIAQKNPLIWFLFLNTREFAEASGIPNIRFLPGTSDPVRKRAFLNSCDAMIHGRRRGETLGMACLEFAMAGKPVLTYADSPELAHLEILGEAAVRYSNSQELKELLRHPASIIRRPFGGGDQRAGDGRRISRFKQYQPEAVMGKFEEVFLR